MDWPRDRLLIQVLDDSDDEVCQMLIKAEVTKWSQRGVNIIYRHRLSRTGYKAGNLKSAMSCDYVKDYEFVAIFDADFQPDPDFLRRTIPYLAHSPEVALVQARWRFGEYLVSACCRAPQTCVAFTFFLFFSLSPPWSRFFVGGSVRFSLAGQQVGGLLDWDPPLSENRGFAIDFWGPGARVKRP